MSQLDLIGFSSSFEAGPRSRFTYRDLRNLRRSSTTCPLRVIALIDFDAFYAQCESVRLGLSPDQPLCVQQWNIVIALNYAAKAAGLKRIISPDEAKLKCPEVILQHVATWREGDTSWAYRPDVRQHMKTDKAALDPYRLQSRKAFELIKSRLPPAPVQKVEKASIDEVFLDLSAQVYEVIIQRYPNLLGTIEAQDDGKLLPPPPTSVLDWDVDNLIAAEADVEADFPDWDDVSVNIGAEIVREVRHDIFKVLQYTCSAGIARNKTLAKLAAGHNKPNQQTVVRARAVDAFYSGYKFTKIRGLGGKLGQHVVKAFDTDQISKLLDLSLQDMRTALGSSGPWVYNVIRGNEYAEVVERTQLQSMLAAKTFVPKAKDLEHAEKWLRIFAGDLMGRLEEQDVASGNRRPGVIALYHAIEGRFGPTRSKQMQIPRGAEINTKLLFDLSRTLLIRLSHEGPTWPCLEISVSLNDFQDAVSNNHYMTTFFAPELRTKDPVKLVEPRLDEVVEANNTDVQMKRKLSCPDSDLPAPAKKFQASPAEDLVVALGNGTSTTCGDGAKPNLYCCPKCNTHLDNASVLEHLDWHIAKELRDAWSQQR